MIEEGKVSLWIGTAPSLDTLEDYIRFRYSDDGDLVLSPFAKDFALGRFDEGKREAEVFDEPRNTLSSLLPGCSYDEVVIPRFMALAGDQLPGPVNAIVLIYDYAFNGVARSTSSPQVQLRGVGVVSYR